MLEGRRISLRPVREADLDRLYDAHTAIAARGAYFPLGIRSESNFRREFAEKGFWQTTEGMLVIATADGEIAGHIEFFRPVSYWDAFELSYQLYDDRHAGKGYVTEAVQLLVDYLFGAKKEHRIHLLIVPETSRRVASPRSAASPWKGLPVARSSTAAGTKTCCSIRCCGPIRARGTQPPTAPDQPQLPRVTRRMRSVVPFEVDTYSSPWVPMTTARRRSNRRSSRPHGGVRYGR